ncbi:UACA protein, partial [Upupa epops]|nr:UACA protein [Upupa epops]
RTALMLGCEYGCKEAVEVLLRNGADASLTDGLGHDCAYYARIGDSIDILALLKAAAEGSGQGRQPLATPVDSCVLPLARGQRAWPGVCSECWRSPFTSFILLPLKELEFENQDLKDRMREVQEEQRMLLGRIGELQLQLNEEQMFADDLENEKDELRKILSAKEKQQEESSRTIEALKAKLKYYEVDSGGAGSSVGSRKEEVLPKQGQALPAESQDPMCAALSVSVPVYLQSRSLLRPLELSVPSQSASSEKEALKKELDNVRTCYGAAREEMGKLQRELSLKASECRALASECERTKAEADGQIRQLEDALRDVQKRMFDSEGKVKQMQTHFLALKEHLTSEAALGSAKVTEELRDQLREMKAKYEGASAEVGKLRNQLKQNELLVAEFKRDEGRLLEENKRLQKELVKCQTERDERGRSVVELEGQLREAAAKLSQSVTAEQFETVKSSLANEVKEKARSVAALEGEREKLQAEVVLLKRELESQAARLAQHVKLEDHERMRSGFEQREEELGKRLSELAQENRALQREREALQTGNGELQQQVQRLQTEMRSQNVPLQTHQELKRASDLAVADLTRELSETTKKYDESKARAEKLLAENKDLSEQLGRLRAVYLSPEQHRKELEALRSDGAERQEQLAELQQKYGEERARACSLEAENAAMREALRDHRALAAAHDQMKTALSGTLEKTERELSDLKGKMEEKERQLLRATEEKGALEAAVSLLRQQMQVECVSVREHEAALAAVNESLREAQESGAAVLAEYRRGQEEIVQLHGEIEAQKKELDTIQECIRSKYTPVASLEEKEQSFAATVEELRAQLREQEHQRRASEEEARKCREENAKLRSGVLAVRADLQHNSVLAEESRRLEKVFAGQMQELNGQLRELLRKYAGARDEEEEEEEGERQEGAVQPQRLPAEQVEAVEKALGRTLEDLKEALRRRQDCYDKEMLKVGELQRELLGLRKASVPLGEHTEVKEALEREMAAVRSSLRAKEEESQAKREEILKLQSEVQLTRQALADLESKEVVDVAEYNSMKSALEAQVKSTAESLSDMSRKYEEARREALQAKKNELSLKEEKESLQLRSCSIEQEIKDQKERCERSLGTISDLQRRIQESAKQVEAKDNKITELLNDVERLKQALSGLSQLTCTAGVPSKRQTQQVEALQGQVRTLQQQLADAKRQHQEVVSVYRTHLLSAVQGHMDEDVQAALLQIIRMRQGLVC